VLCSELIGRPAHALGRSSWTPGTDIHPRTDLSDYSIEALYAHLWHVNAAIVCGFTPRPAPDGTASPGIDGAPAPQELVARATEHQDPHVLKFTEACERDHAIRQDSVYMLAAQSVLQRTPAWS
jgi:hypothetical protein